MILLRLRGRLGNHLFQVFAVIAAAIETGQSFGFYQKKSFPPDGTWWDSVFRQLTHKHVFSKEIIPQYVYTQKGSSSHFDPLSHHVSGWRNRVGHAEGYFIHIKYFEKHFNTIVDILNLRQLQTQVFTSFAPLLSPPIKNWNNTVSLHFRIGDYLTTPGFHVLSPQYYEEALTVLVSQLQTFEVIYFCEVPDIPKVAPVIQMLESKFPGVTFHKVPDGLRDWEEMLFMSCCQHHIIANSTFSLWAALLGVTHDNSSKRVAYPKGWCKPIMGDSMPTNWIAINAV